MSTACGWGTVGAPGKAPVPFRSLSLTAAGTSTPQGASNGDEFRGFQSGSQEAEAQELSRQEEGAENMGKVVESGASFLTG